MASARVLCSFGVRRRGVAISTRPRTGLKRQSSPHTPRGLKHPGRAPTHQPKPETMLCQARQILSSASPRAEAVGSQA